MQSSISNIASNRRNRKLIQLLALPLLISSGFLSGGALSAQAHPSGLPVPSAQFLRVPHSNLRFLRDLGPGYVLAQRISDRRELIIECFEHTPAKIFEIDLTTQKLNLYSLTHSRRWWTVKPNQKVKDPREYLLMATGDGGLNGVNNASGKVIVRPEFSSMKASDKLNFVALKLNNLQTQGDLYVFDKTGRLLNKALDVGPWDWPDFQGGFIEISDHLKQQEGGGLSRGKIGLLNADGKEIYPRVLDSCMIAAIFAQCRKVENGVNIHMVIDDTGREVIRSTDEKLVEKKYKEWTRNWFSQPHPKKSAAIEFYINVESIGRIAEADRSKDTAHFSPILWIENPGKKQMMEGFLQDHKVFGMSKSELQRYLGTGSIFNENGESGISYGLSEGPHCGKSGQSIIFKLNDDKVCNWAYKP